MEVYVKASRNRNVTANASSTLNIHQRQYQYRTKTLKNCINNNVDKTCNSDVNFGVDVDPPELPDKLRNIQPNKPSLAQQGRIEVAIIKERTMTIWHIIWILID